MKLFGIPDVRLFWSEDPRFINQFQEGEISQFQEFSKYPLCYKDLSMWVDSSFNPNDLFEIIREEGGDLVETVEDIMTYSEPATGRISKAYRLCFRSLERTLENAEITAYQMKIRQQIVAKLPTVQLR